MTKLLYKHTTGKITGSYHNIYNGTSRDYPEYIFEGAMIVDLQDEGVRCLRQPEYKIFYKGILIGAQRLDLFVAEEIPVELKVAPALTRLHKAQAISYLKVVDKQVGILCNFGSPTPEFVRVFFHERPPQNPIISLPEAWMQVQKIPLGILVNFYPTSLEFLVLRT